MDDFVQLLGVSVSPATLRANAHVWHDALTAIANKTMDVDAVANNGNETLLHLACYHGEVDVVRQLLALHANPSVETCYKYRPMHYASLSASSKALEICKLLPAADLASLSVNCDSPLDLILKFHTCMAWTDPDLFLWMIQQPQCDVIEDYAGIVRGLCGKESFIPMVDAEVAARKRWGYARAAWCAVCVVCL